MNIEDIKQKIEKNFELYKIGKNEISDEEYDKLVHTLKNLEPECELLKKIQFKNIPEKHNVGYKIENGKVQMARPKGSLEKYYDADKEKITEFIGDQYTFATMKYDGMSCQLLYMGGELIYASTRGDGIIGEDISEAIKHVCNVPTKIDYKGYIICDGEIVCPIEVFDLIFKPKGYKNIRSIVPGICCSKTKLELATNFRFLPFDIETHGSLTTIQKYKLLNEIGFDYDKPVVFKGFTEFNKYVESFLKDKENGKLKVPIDGIVLENSSMHKIAYKFQNKKFYSLVKNIFWKTGKTGNVTPVAELYETEFEGKTMKYVSLSSLNTLIKNKICIDSEVELELTGDVGIQIKKVLAYHGETEVSIPERCPDCNKSIERNGAHLYCSNMNCIGRIKGKLVHHVNRMEIDQLGYERLSKLVDTYNLKEIIDLYDMTPQQFQILGENIGLKIYNKLHEIKELTIPKFISSLSINQLGNTAGSKLENKYKDINVILDLDESGFEGMVSSAYIPSIYEEFNKNRNNYKKLLKYFKIKKFEMASNKLEGMIFVITGSFPNISRSGVEELVKKNGGTIKSTITNKKNTFMANYLICNVLSSSSKCRAAKENNIPIITLAEFQNMI